MTIKLYVEGGGDSEGLRRRAREAFSRFFRKAFAGRQFAVIACGARSAAFDRFKTALQMEREVFSMLLVDSEGPVVAPTAWGHLKAQAQDRWDRPPRASDEQGHLMVQCMEAWLLTDRAALALYYGNGFSEAAIPNWQLIEGVPKKDLFDVLARATAGSKTKGPYSKSKHSWDLLALIDPARVRTAAPHAERLFQAIAAAR